MDGKQTSRWILIAAGITLLLFAGWQVFSALSSGMRILGTVTPSVTAERKPTADTPTCTPAAEIFVPTATMVPVIPAEIRIGKIELDAPVRAVDQVQIEIEEQDYAQFLVPEEFAAGWHTGSAPLGVPGNTVISGHHNAHGHVFANLIELEVGDQIDILDADGAPYSYIIANKMILKEEDEPLDVRILNARWMLPSDDERLTLITCWPEDSNSHRLILVAVPEPDYAQIAEDALMPPSLSAINLKTPAVIASGAGSGTQIHASECAVFSTAGFDINLREIPALHGTITGLWESGTEAQAVGLSANGEWVKLRVDRFEGWTALNLTALACDPSTLPIVD